MTGALLESQPPRIEELGREDRCSSTSTSTSTGTSASISTRSPPLYYGATPLVAGDDRRMNPQQLPKEFEPSTGYDYLDIQASGNDMRYEHNANAPLSTIEGPPQQPTLLNLFNPPITTASPYSTDGGFYHPAASHVFPSLDVRRLGSNTSSTGMAHAHRSTALPHPGTQITARDQYSPATPSFRRVSEHQPRSPSYPTALRRHPISPTSSPITGFTAPAALRMDPGHYPPSSSRTQTTSVPPLSPITTLGVLQSADGSGVPIKIDIHGNIDKGFFLSDDDWTCYRRNYFSCICSFSLSPFYPTHQSLQFIQSGSTQPYTVQGFAMSISAVVSDNDSHTIELVQHTPKRDKGPIARPEKVRLHPKYHQTSHPLGLYSHDTMTPLSRPGFSDGGSFPGSQQAPDSYQTEHTFERIQFKQATANNGKRRAAQQYYHLLIELWAEVNQGPEQFIRIAYRKSAKMIVRGRSPGHYQNERRASTSSGPGGSGGSLTGYPSSAILGSDFSAGGSMMGGGYGPGFDSRGGGHYTARHHPGLDPMIPPEDAKAIETAKDYQYYPGPIYDQPDSRGGVEMFTHHRSGQDSMAPHMTSSYDPLHDRVKRDPEGGMLPSIFQPGALVSSQRCSTYEGKSTSGGYYPTMVPQSGVNLTNMT